MNNVHNTLDENATKRKIKLKKAFEKARNNYICQRCGKKAEYPEARIIGLSCIDANMDLIEMKLNENTPKKDILKLEKILEPIEHELTFVEPYYNCCYICLDCYFELLNFLNISELDPIGSAIDLV